MKKRSTRSRNVLFEVFNETIIIKSNIDNISIITDNINY